MRSIPRILGLSAVLAFLLLLVTSQTPGYRGGPTGYPFVFSNQNPPTCGQINPLNGCGFSYNPALIGLDLLFWAAIAIPLVSVAQLTWTRLVSRIRKDSKAKTL